NLVTAVTDKGDDSSLYRTALLLKRKYIGQNLARMLFIRQGVDGGNGGVARELFDIRLRVSAENSPMNHAAKHAGGVFDRLAATDLDFGRRQKNDLPAQCANADIERNARARGRLGEKHGPDLVRQRPAGMPPSLLLQRHGVGQDCFNLRRLQLFNGKEVSHANASMRAEGRARLSPARPR